MELIHIFPNDREKLCSLLLESRCTRFLFFIRHKNNIDIIEEQFEGKISEGTFLKYINFSVNRLFLRTFLVSFINAMEGPFITDKIFNALLNYPNVQDRESAIVSLSHKALTEQQVKRLCETNICFECYFEYVIRLYLSETATEDDFREAIVMFLESPFAEMKNILQEELKTAECTNETKTILLDLLS